MYRTNARIIPLPFRKKKPFPSPRLGSDKTASPFGCGKHLQLQSCKIETPKSLNRTLILFRQCKTRACFQRKHYFKATAKHNTLRKNE